MSHEDILKEILVEEEHLSVDIAEKFGTSSPKKLSRRSKRMKKDENGSLSTKQLTTSTSWINIASRYYSQF
jgi:hypothetical protein